MFAAIVGVARDVGIKHVLLAVLAALILLLSVDIVVQLYLWVFQPPDEQDQKDYDDYKELSE